MTPMDIFIYLLSGTAALLVLIAFRYLLDNRLELGALVGIYPLMWGMGLGALAGLLWCIQHLSIHTR